ncbi:hypothetical protein FPQ18DRAFT_400632 [Pyronema domesticum]|uniref:Uncharacterized protein n=1 Tax=Pyronema omphalodes (strain CBS 100304) TaxID=1076935 RepID=U4LDJ1_PYROM|nr:hypothetical protein FPQ18DRAFT_400632 [Pyronema domesticum]CCX29597.1 Protein of unknown function [Pyronema omphalodes CBS 100304]
MSPLNEARTIVAYWPILQDINIKFNKELGAIICLKCASSLAVVRLSSPKDSYGTYDNSTNTGNSRRPFLQMCSEYSYTPPVILGKTPQGTPRRLSELDRFTCCVAD